MQKTAEFVTPRHPDKMCDFIADSILDAFLKEDKRSRVAVEVMGGHGVISISGEITSGAKIDREGICGIVKKIVPKMDVRVYISPQSKNIASGVDTGGAGDQGIMVGHACRGTTTFMPVEYELARQLCQKIYDYYPVDGKTQVTIDADSKKVLKVVASFQGTKTKELEKLVRNLVKAKEYFINPAGEWPVGGFDADSGLSGRKLIVDNYGPEYQIGGGSFSGKDCTKVDRSGAYMARRVAVDYLLKHNANKVMVKLAYAIGVAEPVMAVAIVDGKPMEIIGYDLTPEGIRKALKLDDVKFAETARWGHFGRNFNWS